MSVAPGSRAPAAFIPLLLCLCLSGVSWPSGVGALAAQTVRGAVFSEHDGAPIEGAFVSLVDAAGVELAGDLTNADGHFEVEVPGSHEGGGSLLLRVARIGIRTWTSPPIDIGAERVASVRLEVPILPVRLTTIDVTVHDQCVVDPEVEGEVWAVWDEARKALRTTALAEREDAYRFEMRLFQREIDPESGEVLRVLSRIRAPFARTPFRSLSPSAFAANGYARMEGDSIRYYMPDADALLSPEFEAAHCFGLRRRGDEDQRQIGVTFRPVEDGRTEIRGVLWIDEATAELRTLEYKYVDPPLGIRDERLGGTAEYRRLPGGTFVVTEWAITMPQVERMVDFAGRHLRDRIGSLKEDGGVVFGVFTPRGEPVRMTGPPGG